LSQGAFRAAGQALAALWQGTPIDHVDIDGIALAWPDEPTREQACVHAAIEIAIGLTGIVAQSRYRFGWAPDHESVVSWQFDECQLKDFCLVHALVAEIETDDVDVFYRSWCRALKFASDLTKWSAIESIAETVEHQWLTAIEVERVAADAFWNSVVIAPEVAGEKPAGDVQTGSNHHYCRMFKSDANHYSVHSPSGARRR
jgi:hypothetical protein